MSMSNDRDAERAADNLVPVTRKETLIRDAEMRRARSLGGKVAPVRMVAAVTAIPKDAEYVRRFGSRTLADVARDGLAVTDDQDALAATFERFAFLSYRHPASLSGDERRELRSCESLLALAGAFRKS